MKAQIMEHLEQPNMTNMTKHADFAVPPLPQDIILNTKVHKMEQTKHDLHGRNILWNFGYHFLFVFFGCRSISFLSYSQHHKTQP